MGFQNLVDFLVFIWQIYIKTKILLKLLLKKEENV